jgi:hypothetical protein
MDIMSIVVAANLVMRIIIDLARESEYEFRSRL